jgi:hypothetical protein
MRGGFEILSRQPEEMKSDLIFSQYFCFSGIHLKTDRMRESNTEGAISGNFEESRVGHFDSEQMKQIPDWLSVLN